MDEYPNSGPVLWGWAAVATEVAVGAIWLAVWVWLQ